MNATLNALAAAMNLTTMIEGNEFSVTGAPMATAEFMHAAVDAGATFLGTSVEFPISGPALKSTRRFLLG